MPTAKCAFNFRTVKQ